MIYLLHQALDRSAERYPDHPAMRFNGRGLTYREMAEKTNQLARLLVEQGVCKGDRVGVFMDKSLETPVAIYGIMKAGAAYVPIDPKSPVSRVAHIIEDCQLKGIVTDDKRFPAVQAACQPDDSLRFFVGVSVSESSRDKESEGRPIFSWNHVYRFDKNPPIVDALMEQDLAYIMYTSGSTGQPKGIMHTHYSGLSYARLSAETYQITNEDRLSNHSPLHFDMSTLGYLTGPYCGATTIIIPDAYTIFPANLSKLIQDERLTIWYSVPFALIQLLLRGVIDQRDLSSLRWVLYGGEPFQISHLRDLLNRLPQARFSNVYGPAEVNQCTYYHLPPVSQWAADFEAVPIGRIWGNSYGLVLDEEDQLVGEGEIGELVVRTPTMMAGYWNRPDLNERAFYYDDSSFHRHTYYRTGDLACMGRDGEYSFFGRKDYQVKIRGYRLELGELDRVLAKYEAVEQGVNYVTPDVNGDYISASVMLREGCAATENDLIIYMSRHLPPYAVPKKIHFVSQLPLTATDKINRRAAAAEGNSRHT